MKISSPDEYCGSNTYMEDIIQYIGYSKKHQTNLILSDLFMHAIETPKFGK